MTDDGPVWWGGVPERPRPGPLVVVVTAGLDGPHRYAPLLNRLVRRGHAVLATGPPGTAPGSRRPEAALSRLVDDGTRVAMTEQVHVIGFGFGGRLALGAAARDDRIRVVQLVGAPVARLFDEPELLLSLPKGELDTLVRMTGAGRRDLLPEALGTLALRPETLYPLSGLVRVAYGAEDPLTPPQDLALLKLTLARSEFRAFPAGVGGIAPSRAVRRWLVDGVRPPPPRRPSCR
ncbi:alpha/beta fold hydrolase [Streptomyces sp. NPDC093065]|uniref:alpha/beta fold hydrolase n=1 Tax=Streptomyces sp. NPDC093065 TaxID=3366021 RepID=UPI00381BAB09